MKLFFSKIFFFFLKETNWILLVVAQGTLCAVFPSHALISLFSQRNSTASEAQDTETLWRQPFPERALQLYLRGFLLLTEQGFMLTQSSSIFSLLLFSICNTNAQQKFLQGTQLTVFACFSGRCSRSLVSARSQAAHLWQCSLEQGLLLLGKLQAALGEGQRRSQPAQGQLWKPRVDGRRLHSLCATGLSVYLAVVSCLPPQVSGTNCVQTIVLMGWLTEEKVGFNFLGKCKHLDMPRKGAKMPSFQHAPEIIPWCWHWVQMELRSTVEAFQQFQYCLLLSVLFQVPSLPKKIHWRAFPILNTSKLEDLAHRAWPWV